MDSTLAKAKPFSGSTHVITYLRRGEKTKPAISAGEKSESM